MPPLQSQCQALSTDLPSAPATRLLGRGSVVGAAPGAAPGGGLMRLRGGAIFDQRTKAVWPTGTEEIPEDGSVGGQYSMEECIAGQGKYVGVCPCSSPLAARDLFSCCRGLPPERT